MRPIPKYLAPLALTLAAIVMITMATSRASQPAGANSQEGEEQLTLWHELTKEDIRAFIAQARQEPWSISRVRLYEAEATPEQSIYLACVQLIEIERAHGDPRKAVQDVERIAERAKSQQLRNAIRRLLAEVSLEYRDFKGAESYLNKIIEESLLQQ